MKQYDTIEGSQRDDSQIAPTQDSSTEEAERRNKVVQRLIKTRAMLQETRNRSAELQCALDRFKYQQKKIANG
jgi:hypothetical protein